MKHGIISGCKRNGIGKSRFITKFSVTFVIFCISSFSFLLSFFGSLTSWTFSVSYSPGSLISYYFISGYFFPYDLLISTLNIIFALNELPLSWPSSVIIVNLPWLFLCSSKVWPVMYTHNSQIYVPSSGNILRTSIHISNYLYDIYFIDFSKLSTVIIWYMQGIGSRTPRYQNLRMLKSLISSDIVFNILLCTLNKL